MLPGGGSAAKLAYKKGYGMETLRLSCVTVAALALLSPGAFSQGKPDHIEAGTGAKGLPKGQIRPMTVEFAKRLVAAAKKAACTPPAGSCSGAFAVVDDAGVLVYLETIDGVLAGGPELAIRKARTPALWRRPTQVFLDAVKDGSNPSYADGTFPDMTTSPGGVPVSKDGRIVGGVGIAAVGSGSQQIDDAILAEAAKIFGPQ
jgi:glc operon protein GlcG